MMSVMDTMMTMMSTMSSEDASSSSSSSPTRTRTITGNTPTTTSTASGYLALLQEDDIVLKSHAVMELLNIVELLWHEIAEYLSDLEGFAEDNSLPKELQKNAALLASHVFFYLDEPHHALRLALMADEHTIVETTTTTTSISTSSSTPPPSPYVQRLVTAALDAYVAARRAQWEKENDDILGTVTAAQDGAGAGATSTTGDVTMKDTAAATITGDKKEGDDVDNDHDALQQKMMMSLSIDQLQGMVDRLLKSACDAGHYRYALGVAFESREKDRVLTVLKASGPSLSMLQYAINAAASNVVNAIQSKSFRQDALQVVADLLSERFQKQPTKVSSKRKGGRSNNQKSQRANCAYDLVRVFQLLEQPQSVAIVLMDLLSTTSDNNDDDDDEFLLALQLCFDLMDSGDQSFCRSVAEYIQQQEEESKLIISTSTTNNTTADDDGVPVSTTSTTTTTTNTKKKDRYEKLMRVLVGGFSSELALSFLYKQSNSDRLIMENLKRIMEERSSGSRSSLLHNAAVITHAYLYAGTTNDSFLRDHLDWMKKASNWAKFSATASLGVVHASHITEAMHLLQPYLPPAPAAGAESPAVSPAGGYAEGGSLYALGLIHGSQSGSSAEKRYETMELLRSHLRASHANEVMSHGAALGVGLTAMGTADLAIVNELKEVLDTDSAVAGEAAGIAIGMVLVGTGAANIQQQSSSSSKLPSSTRDEILELIVELKNYARETQHEKIIRGIALGLALMNFGQEDNADATILEMRSDRDPVMRYGAQYAIALAYCGTGSNKAIRILLHTAVSDVSDDVRMAAVIGLAFVLFKTPHRVPQLVNLLLESFNPHVRYASCMAVGIAMAGTGDADSIALLEPILDDMTDYVRQGALMGTAMIYMQQSDHCNHGKIRTFRERLTNIVSEKHQSNLTKMGAILSTGIIDAGGRNCSLVLGSRSGFVKMSSAVGLVLWLQHWHWYPMMHMFSLALTPTYTIGLNKDLKFPKSFSILCNARPSRFSYPAKLEEKKEEKKKRLETVTLSTTAKEKARLIRKQQKQQQQRERSDNNNNNKSTTTEGGGGGNGTAAAAASAMDVDGTDGSTISAAVKVDADNNDGKTGGDAMDVDVKDGTTDDDAGNKGNKTTTTASKNKKKKEPEPKQFRLNNPTRITKLQSTVCEYDLNQRYRPIRYSNISNSGKGRKEQLQQPFGVIILTDSTPEKEEDVGAVKAPSLEPEGELAPPEPFEWSPPPEAEEPVVSAAATAGTTTSDDNDSKKEGDNNNNDGDDDDANRMETEDTKDTKDE